MFCQTYNVNTYLIDRTMLFNVSSDKFSVLIIKDSIIKVHVQPSIMLLIAKLNFKA